MSTLVLQTLKNVFVCKVCGKEKVMPSRTASFRDYEINVYRFEVTHKACAEKLEKANP